MHLGHCAHTGVHACMRAAHTHTHTHTHTNTLYLHSMNPHSVKEPWVCRVNSSPPLSHCLKGNKAATQERLHKAASHASALSLCHSTCNTCTRTQPCVTAEHKYHLSPIVGVLTQLHLMHPKPCEVDGMECETHYYRRPTLSICTRWVLTKA